MLTSSVVYTTANSVFNIYVRISMKSTPSISAGNDNLISLLKEFFVIWLPSGVAVFSFCDSSTRRETILLSNVAISDEKYYGAANVVRWQFLVLY